MKVLVVGGTRAVGKEICEAFAPHSLGLGRSNGYDIGKAEDRRRIVELSRGFDLVLNHAHNGHASGQTQLLIELFHDWAERKKDGYLFTTGSYATYMLLREYRRYAVIKHFHDQVSRSLAERIQHEKLPFRLTNLRLGTLRKEGGARGLGGGEIAAWMRNLHESRGLLVPDLVIAGETP